MTAVSPSLNRDDSRGLYAEEGLAEALPYYRAGQYDKAETVYRNVLKKDASNAGALHMLGLIAHKKGRSERAVQLLIKAARAAPNRPEILCDLGNAFKAVGRYVDAVKAHKMVLQIMPASPEAFSNLGSAYKAAGKAARAVECFEKAVKLRPNDTELRYNLGNGLIAAERYEDAEDELRRVVYERPDNVRAHINLGISLKEQGKHKAAIERFQEAIKVRPDNAEAHWNLALTHLALGEYGPGWREYEWRRQLVNFPMQKLNGPIWEGDSLEGRTLLVYPEQGLGDTIQFARYLPLLSRFGGSAVLACPGRMVPILASIDNMPEIAADTELPEHDVHVSLMSLPRLFFEGRPYAPERMAYLSSTPERLSQWQERLGRKEGFRVGIAWQGNPDYRHDARRSIPLACFERLARNPQVQLVSLQTGPAREQLAQLSWGKRVIDFGDRLDEEAAFIDTLALMKSLDVVVTSDTAVAHVAGGGGVPVWVALCHEPDWRWGLSGETTPWYPLMRLCRQDRPGEWGGVFDRIAQEIANRI